MLNNLSYKELLNWIDYFSIEPFSEERADLRNAQLSALIANIWRGKDSREFSVQDFLFDFWGESSERKETPEQLQKKVELLNVMFKGRDLRK